MPVTAAQILSAIEVDELDQKLVADGDEFAVVILAGGSEVARVGCLRAGRPKATLTRDGRSVDVFPSPGLPDSFTIACDDHEEAILIQEALNGCFGIAYLNLVDPDR